MNLISNPTLPGATWRLIVCGGRTYDDYEYFCREMDRLLSEKIKSGVTIEIVHGDCRRYRKMPDGTLYELLTTDTMADLYGKERGFIVTPVPAPWRRYGKAAGPFRNAQMAQYGHACVAFWNKKSPGTKNMITLARKRELPTKIIYVKYKTYV